MKKLISYSLCLVTLLFFACKDDESDTASSNNTLDYDQTAFLTNLGQNIITPRYESLQSKVNDLETKTKAFNASPSTTTLQSLKTSYLDAYKQFQYCVVFDFGPAAGSKNLNAANIYPVDTATVKSSISSGSYSFGAANQVDAQGFPAVDYLLYHSDEATVVTEFADTKRQKFLIDVVTNIKTLIDEVTSSWKTSYTTTFITSTGNDAGSSIGFLVNQFNFTFEDIKNFKIGTPSGSRSSLGTTFPEKVEAYYSKQSLVLAQANLTSLEELYKGVSTTGTNGQGFDDYLQALNQGTLDNTIQSNFTGISNSLKGLESVQGGVFSDIIKSENSKMSATFNVFSKSVAPLKSEMASVLGVQITYEDGDGD